MNERNSDATNTADREIVTTRVFDAPRELVFKVCTKLSGRGKRRPSRR